jgi:hypothetical protein
MGTQQKSRSDGRIAVLWGIFVITIMTVVAVCSTMGR